MCKKDPRERRPVASRIVGCATALLAILAVPRGTIFGQIPPFEQLVHLYDYDKSTPLELKRTLVDDQNGITIHWITFNVTGDVHSDGILVAPKDSNRHAGIVWLHSGSAFQWLPDALLMARVGAVSLIVSPDFGSPDLPAEKYRRAMISTVVSIRRAVDVLCSRPDVDPMRLAFVGHSFGSMLGAVAVPVDKRFRAAVFEVGVPGMTYHLRTSPVPWAAGHRARLGAGLDNYLKVIAPIDAIHYVGFAAPTTLLFQSASLDPGVSKEDSLEFFNAASNPKELKWYTTAHDVTDIAAISDRARFLSKELKLGPIEPVLREKIGVK